MTARWAARWVTAAAVAVPLAVYLRTMARSVPFWDAGEFIAVAKILGVPHPPGTPLYVLVAHLFGLLPFWNYATRINFLSVAAGLTAVAFTCLIVQKMVLHALEGVAEEGTRRILGAAGGVCAAWFTAFSSSFWDSSVETEVYCGASALMMFAAWMALNWWERRGEDGNERRLLMIWYLLCAGIGWHLGGFLIMPAIVAFAAVADWRRSWWLGLGAVALGAWHRWTGYWQDAVHVASDTQAILLSAAGLVGIGVALHLLLPRPMRKLGWLVLAAFVVGVSSHAYLVIRARQGPVINEASPSGWDSLWDVFNRKQYVPPPVTQRQGSWTYQMDTMFFRYFQDEFTLGPPMRSYPGVKPWGGLLGLLAVGVPLALGEFGRLYQLLAGRPRAVAWGAAHLAAWAVLGILYQGLGQRALAISLAFLMLAAGLGLAAAWRRPLSVFVHAFFLVTTLGLIVYLNFKDPQVRERDYFFLWGFEAFALWMGVGLAGAVVEVLRVSRAGASRRFLVPVLAALGLLLPAATCAHYWFELDHTGNDVARDYAWNMISPLGPGAILFSNGDNDTFPIWYIQEVEGVRKDVRLVNLSLLNTHWYIKQLRDLPPRVPIRMTDAEIDALEPTRDADGTIHWVRDVMVQHILDQNAWRKPLYLAVTVPDQMGLKRRLSLEGLTFRILPDTSHPAVNEAVTRDLIYHRYRYGGLLDAAGRYDSIPYKDENARHLAGNYAGAHVRLAFASRDRHDFRDAFEELDRAEAICKEPDFAGVAVARGHFHEEAGDTASAIAAYLKGTRDYPGNAELHYRLGSVYTQRGQVRDAIRELQAASSLEPDNGSVAIALFMLKAQGGQVEAADREVRAYLDRHPEDGRALQIYRSVMRGLGRQPADVTTPQALPAPSAMPQGGM